MTRRTRIWQAVAGLFVLINAGGAIVALVQGEPMHAGVHVLAAGLVGVYWTRRLWSVGAPAAAAVTGGPFDDRLTSLEQSIDAVAIEVERIGEGQRFMTRALTEEPVEGPEGEAKPRRDDSGA